MEYHHSYSSVESRGRVSPQRKETKKLGSILKLDRLSYEDFHPQIVLKHMDSHLLGPKGSQQKQVERNSSMSEELVKYMSNLPCYLEKGKHPQEKAFSVGVLDWRVLEKWQKLNYNKDITQTNSYSSSFISSGGSSSGCSRGRSWSPQRQKMNQSRVNAPVPGGCSSSSTSPFSLDSERFQDCEDDGFVSTSSGVQSRSMATQFSSVETAERKSEDLGRRRIQKISPPHIESGGITFVTGSKGKEVNHHGGTVTTQQSVQAPSYANVCVSPEWQKAADGNQGTGNKRQSDSSKGNNHILLEPSLHGRGSSATNFPSDYTRAKDLSSEEEQLTSQGDVTVSPSVRKTVELESSSSMPRKLADEEIPQSKMGIKESSKVGNNSSENRRYSFGLGRMGKKNVASALKFSVSEDLPDSRINSSSSNSTSEKPNAKSRSRSSPLRRLLNPLFKPKNCESNHSAKSLDLDPSTTAKSLQSTSKRREAPLKVMLELQRDKNGSSRIQALLQVAVKNGLPLFTFTVENYADILVATAKESSLPKQGAHSRFYTFFSISEMQKKNAHWMNKGGSKESHQTYVSNAVAQMRVSGLQLNDSIRNGPAAVKSSVREFVLTSMETDSAPNDELAAVIVKFPENCSNSEDGNFNAMAILPGGDHGVPRKGDPSSLIERWRSGGSCDCGGWDLGCRIRTLANNHQLCHGLDSTKPESTSFKLFSQDEVEENSKPLFILSPFKDGIFSVAFHPSIQLIQAFSIGIAILNSSSKDDALVGSNISEEVASENCRYANRAAVDVSADYVWNPPLSPFGRV